MSAPSRLFPFAPVLYQDGTMYYATYSILARISSTIPGFGRLLGTWLTLRLIFSVPVSERESRRGT
mgnify:CR=1 FL=1